MKIAYVEHPCSAEQKQALNQKGFQVVDAKFAPDVLNDGDELILKDKPKPKRKETKE